MRIPLLTCEACQFDWNGHYKNFTNLHLFDRLSRAHYATQVSIGMANGPGRQTSSATCISPRQPNQTQVVSDHWVFHDKYAKRFLRLRIRRQARWHVTVTNSHALNAQAVNLLSSNVWIDLVMCEIQITQVRAQCKLRVHYVTPIHVSWTRLGFVRFVGWEIGTVNKLA